MGGAASTSEPAAVQYNLQKSEKEVVKLMMPVYFLQADITLEERKIASNSWDLILNEKSPYFLSRRGQPDFPYNSCVTFFYDSFYLRLFDVHPLCRHLFKNGMKSQGKFLVKMISLALSELDDRDKFDRNLVKLAEIHFQRGVKAVEYGIVGEVLFWVLKHCLGPTVYTQSVHVAWVKVYSRMLRTIVPVAVGYEIKGGAAAKSTHVDRSTIRDSFMFSDNRVTPMAEIQEDDNEVQSEKVRQAESTHPLNQMR